MMWVETAQMSHKCLNQMLLWWFTVFFLLCHLEFRQMFELFNVWTVSLDDKVFAHLNAITSTLPLTVHVCSSLCTTFMHYSKKAPGLRLISLPQRWKLFAFCADAMYRCIKPNYNVMCFQSICNFWIVCKSHLPLLLLHLNILFWPVWLLIAAVLVYRVEIYSTCSNLYQLTFKSRPLAFYMWSHVPPTKTPFEFRFSFLN